MLGWTKEELDGDFTALQQQLNNGFGELHKYLPNLKPGVMVSPYTIWKLGPWIVHRKIDASRTVESLASPEWTPNEQVSKVEKTELQDVTCFGSCQQNCQEKLDTFLHWKIVPGCGVLCIAKCSKCPENVWYHCLKLEKQ